MNVLRELWQGKYSLPVAFWGFYCLGLFMGLFATGIIFFLVFGLAGDNAYARSITFTIALVLSHSYWLVATVGVWRSAGASWTSPIWLRRIGAAAARTVVTGWVAVVIYSMADGGAVAVIHRIAGDTDF